jgi:hypothetical protein
LFGRDRERSAFLKRKILENEFPFAVRKRRSAGQTW